MKTLSIVFIVLLAVVGLGFFLNKKKDDDSTTTLTTEGNSSTPILTSTANQILDIIGGDFGGVYDNINLLLDDKIARVNEIAQQGNNNNGYSGSGYVVPVYDPYMNQITTGGVMPYYPQEVQMLQML